MKGRDWALPLSLDETRDEPLFLQIARGIADAARRGRVRPGDPIPGSRTLAATLHVHRNTVLAAYRELEAEGWLTTARGRGTFVSDALPEPKPRRFAPPLDIGEQRLRVGFDLRPAPEPHAAFGGAEKGRITFDGGTPDLRLLDVATLSRAYRRVLKKRGRQLLAYSDPRGHPDLRAELGRMLSAMRGLTASADSVVVTRGSQMALSLVARALIGDGPLSKPADLVAVEALGYRPAWEAFRSAGARLAPIPVDEAGIRVDVLADLAERERVRAVYVTPHHQYPTTVGMSAARRLALLELARQRRFAIVEDDYDYEFHYDGRPMLPLASADVAGVVVYIGTLSKILAPGLRLGFVVAPQAFIAKLAAHRIFLDRQGDHALECAIAELIEEGEVQRHARRVRRIYRTRRDTLVHVLERELGGAVRFESPPGGMAVWVTAQGIDVDAWAARAESHRVSVSTGHRYAFDGRARPTMRLGFASLSDDEIAEGIRRLAKAL